MEKADKCPKCFFENPSVGDFESCPKCGIVLSKFIEKEDTPREDTPREDTPREDTPREDTPREDTPRAETLMKCKDCYLFHRVGRLGLGLCTHEYEDHFMSPTVRYEEEDCCDEQRRIYIEARYGEDEVNKLKEDRKRELIELDRGLSMFRSAKRMFPAQCEKLLNAGRSDLEEKVKKSEDARKEREERERIIERQKEIIKMLQREPPTRRIGIGLRIGPKLWFDIGKKKFKVK